jgi:hypothetical protein
MIRQSPVDTVHYPGIYTIEDDFNAGKPIITEISKEDWNNKDFRLEKIQYADNFFEETKFKKIVVRFETNFFHSLLNTLAPILWEYKKDPDIEVILLHPSKELSAFHSTGSFVVQVLRNYNIKFSVTQIHSKYPPIFSNFYYYENIEMCGEYINILEDLISKYRNKSLPNNKKVYISRGSKQNLSVTQLHQMTKEEIEKLPYQDDLRIDDEISVENLFKKHGFEIVDTDIFKTVEDQIRFFDQVQVVAGLSGSGLTNLLFMRDKTTVIELSTIQIVRQRAEFHYHFFLIATLWANKKYISIPNISREYGKIEYDLEKMLGLL